MPRSIFYQPATANPDTGSWWRARGTRPFDIPGLANGTEYRFHDGQTMFLRTPEAVVTGDTGIRLFNQADGQPVSGVKFPWSSGNITATSDAGGYMRVVHNQTAAQVRTALTLDGVGPFGNVEILTKVWIENMRSTTNINNIATALGLGARMSGSAGSETGEGMDLRMRDESLDTSVNGYTFRVGPGYDNGTVLPSIDFGVPPTFGEWWYLRYNSQTGDAKAWTGGPENEADAFVGRRAPQLSNEGGIGLWFFSRGIVRVEFISWGLNGAPGPFPS